MTDEQIRVAIAEACGPKLFVLHKPIHDPFGYYRENACGYTGNIKEAWMVTLEVGKRYTNGQPDQPDRVVLEPVPLPDYLNDLNAMHEAEKYLEEHCHIATYLHHLEGFTKWSSVHATARQRSEAFLRTLDKWTE